MLWEIVKQLRPKKNRFWVFEKNKRTKPWTLKVALRPSGVSLVGRCLFLLGPRVSDLKLFKIKKADMRVLVHRVDNRFQGRQVNCRDRTRSTVFLRAPLCWAHSSWKLQRWRIVLWGWFIVCLGACKCSVPAAECACDTSSEDTWMNTMTGVHWTKKRGTVECVQRQTGKWWAAKDFVFLHQTSRIIWSMTKTETQLMGWLPVMKYRRLPVTRTRCVVYGCVVCECHKKNTMHINEHDRRCRVHLCTFTISWWWLSSILFKGRMELYVCASVSNLRLKEEEK